MAEGDRGEADDEREAEVEPDEVGVAGVGEPVRVEHPGGEGGEGADAAAGDDHQRLAFQGGAGDEAERQRPGQVDRQDAERERVVGARREGGVDQEAGRGGGAAEQADGDPAGGAHRAASGRRSSAIPARTQRKPAASVAPR